ncbi:MAG: ferritin-like domain-containing protein [Ilumatobacteraceae bacterium]
MTRNASRTLPTVGLRVRLALAALVVPLGFGAAACKGGLTDSPTPSTVPSTEIIVIEGRPLRRRNGRLRRARSRRGHGRITDRQALALGTSERAALAEYWRNQGELEHASVVAFDDLARRLGQVDAPDELLRRTVRAADQEANHADLCFELAGRYLGETVHAGRLRRPHRLPRSRTSELTQLAVEALRDGVLNEGYAALLASAKAERAADVRVREALQIIARDEAQHAALSSDVLAWCIAEGGDIVVEAVIAAASELPTRMYEPALAVDVDSHTLADHGMFNADDSGDGYATILRDTLQHVPAVAANSVD